MVFKPISVFLFFVFIHLINDATLNNRLAPLQDQQLTLCVCVFSDNALSMLEKRFYLLSRLSITFTKLVCMLLPVLFQSFVDVVGYLGVNVNTALTRCFDMESYTILF